MSRSRTQLNRGWRGTRPARLIVLVAAFTAATAAVAPAQTKDASPQPSTPADVTPQAEFQYSALSGSGNTILATRVPAVTSTGKTLYWDVTLLFDVDSNGNLTLDPAYPQIVPSPNLITAGFQAGNYAGPSTILNGKALVTISGPGVAPGGATEWSLAASTGAASCTYPATATWYVGPFATNPWMARIKAAGISLTQYANYSWGATGGTSCYSDWQDNSLIGLSQTNGTLTILSFTYAGKDYSTARDQITYTPTGQ